VSPLWSNLCKPTMVVEVCCHHHELSNAVKVCCLHQDVLVFLRKHIYIYIYIIIFFFYFFWSFSNKII
jgi:hypothetical protein